MNILAQDDRMASIMYYFVVVWLLLTFHFTEASAKKLHEEQTTNPSSESESNRVS